MDAQFQVTCDHVVGNPPQNFVLQTCPRCLGFGFYHASSFGMDGKIITLSGSPLLSQQIQKILTEDKRPTGYGFDYTVLSGTINSGTITAVKSEVLRCLQYLATNQQTEKQAGYQYLPTEEIANVSGVDATQDANDPRQVNVSANVVTVSGVNLIVNVPLRR